VKLWKHHAAQPQADRINALAAKRGDAFLADYGGRTSSEWLVAKALQALEEDPDVYAAAASFVEAGDWLVSALTGKLVRNSCGAGYKGFWSAERGFPPREFFRALDARFADMPEKLGGEIMPPGRAVGWLGIGPRVGVVVAANLAALAAGTMLVALVRSEGFASGVAHRSAWLLALAPSASHGLLRDAGSGTGSFASTLKR